MHEDQTTKETAAPNGGRLLELVGRAAEKGRRRVAVVWPCSADEELRWTLHEAEHVGLARIMAIGQPDVARFDWIEAKDPGEAARQAVALVGDGRVDALMNGMAAPEELLAAMLDPNVKLKPGRNLTAVSVIDAQRLGRLVLVADSGVSARPELEAKVGIVRNAVEVAHRLGIGLPRIAVLSATEVVNPKAASSLDAAQLSKMSQRGQITGCLIDGPLALDNAVSIESAKVKGIRSDVAGLADVLIAPDVETASMLVRAVTHVSPTVTATVVIGGPCPVALPSRSDSAASKLASLALAVWLVSAQT